MNGVRAVSASLRNPEKLPTSDLLVLAGVAYVAAADGVTHEPFGSPNGPGLWHHKGMQLPAYIQQVAHDIMESGTTESRAIATAVSRCKVWCATSKDPAVKAKACSAVAEWEALKARSHADTKAAFNPKEPRDPSGKWTLAGAIKSLAEGASMNHGGIEVKRDIKSRSHWLHVTIGGKKRIYTTDAEAHRAVHRKAHQPGVSYLPEHEARAQYINPKSTDEQVREAARSLRFHGSTDHNLRQISVRRVPPKAAAALATIPNVDLLAAGTWDLSSGPNTFTRGDIASAAEATKCPAVGDPVIKLGHIDPRFDGQPAIGRVRNMRPDASGMKLVGDLVDMPGWLAEIAHAAFPKRSVEGTYEFKCQVGHTHPFVLTGLALLGVTPPGVGVLNDLPDIAALYGVNAAQAAVAAEQPWVLTLDEGGPLVAVTEEDVRRAYYATGPDQGWWISEMQMHPAQLVVSAGDGSLFRVPFQISDEGELSFGDAEPVADYADLAAARGRGRLITYASAADSREGVEPDDEDEPGEDPEGEPGEDEDPEDVEAADYTGPYADPKNKKYKLGTKEQARAAWSYINMPKNAELYPMNGVTLKEVRDAIMAACKKFGIEVSDDTKASASEPPEMSGPDEMTGDKDNAMMGHGPMTGTHSHPHSAYGSQGSDQTHSHQHTHKGDNVHDHAHANAGAGNKEGVSEVDLTSEHMTSLRASLGLAEDDELNPDTLVTAAAALKAKADAKVTAAARKLPDGVITVEQEVWEGLHKKVEAAEQFRQRTLRNERDEIIDSAIRAGKFSASRKGHWQRLYDADPEGTRQVLAELKRNTVPVEDIGGAGGNFDDETFESEFAGLYPPGEYGKGR